MKLSVVIPARNEEKRIHATIRDVDSYLKKQSYNYEIIVMVNNSHDGTLDILNQLQPTVKNLKVVALVEGGKGNAVKEGILKYADGDIIMFMDADNATPIYEIEKFLLYFNEGYDIVIGSRYINPKLVKNRQPLYRVILSRLSNVIIQAMVAPGIKDTQLGFKAFTQKSAKDIFSLVSIPGWAFDMEILTASLAHHYRVKEVGVSWTEYGGGQLPMKAYVQSLRDLFKIKINSILGVYISNNEKLVSQAVTMRDYDFAGLTGFLTGIFVIPIVLNIGLHPSFIILFPFIGCVGAISVIWLGKVLSRWQKTTFQFAKFSVIGILNASINFGLLNFISLVTGITGGLLATGYNVPGTVLAALNSYLWNKFWVFKLTKDGKGVFYHFPKFALVVLLDIVVNSFIIFSFTTYLHPIFGVGSVAWLNVAKMCATVIVMFLNFFGYKFIVFKKKTI